MMIIYRLQIRQMGRGVSCLLRDVGRARGQQDNQLYQGGVKLLSRTRLRKSRIDKQIDEYTDIYIDGQINRKIVRQTDERKREKIWLKKRIRQSKARIGKSQTRACWLTCTRTGRCPARRWRWRCASRTHRLRGRSEL